MCFGNTRCDHTHPNLTDKFDADTGGTICVFQIMNQLCQIFNGVDIVMRRWTDQTNARRAVPNPGNVGIHFPTRQFATFTRLRCLRDFDLNFICIGKILNGYPEPT